MLNNCCTGYLAEMPDVTIYMNCDTRLAINLRLFDLNENDEFIFVIKNYDYIDSSYVFLFRARKRDMDKNGEVIFSIDPDTSKHIKPGAFYNFALLANAFNPYEPTEYKKLTKNGKVIVEYGAHDLALPEIEKPQLPFNDILAAHLEPVDEAAAPSRSVVNGVIVDMKLEERV